MLVFWIGAGSDIPIRIRFIFQRIAYMLPIILTVVFTVAAARRSVGPERRFWALLAVANGALVACDITYVTWVAGFDPSGPARIAFPFQPLHGIAAVAFLGVLASMTRFSVATTTAKIRYGTDVVVLALVVYALGLELYARPVMEPAGGTLGDVLIGAGYVAVAVLMLVGAALNVFGLKMLKWRSWERLVMLALAVYVAGVFLWPSWFSTAEVIQLNATRGVLDFVQLTGHYVLMMAAVYRLTEREEWFVRPLPPFRLTRRRWLAALFPAASLAAIAVVLVAAYVRRADTEWLYIYGVIGGLIVAASITRSTLTALEHSSLFHRAITDPLTGLYNHRYFHDRLAEEVESALRLGEDLSVVVMDIDDFGHINALHGHSEGDRFLAMLAERMCAAVSEDCVVARIGGDEFAAILPQTGVLDAAVFSQRLVDMIEIEGGVRRGPASASAGVASLPEHATSASDLFRLADCAMLWAKERGKNQVVVFETGRVPDLTSRERIESLERQSRLSSVRALAAAVDARDPATRFHSQNVAVLAIRLGQKLGLDSEHVRFIGQAALMHDVGKIAVPDSVLGKPGPLTLEERQKVQEHPILGERVLAATELRQILPWVRSHHEWWDGSGYPDGLRGESIPLEARVLSLCDAYDAMISDRPYRNALSHAAAVQEIDLHMGTQFDSYLADLFITMVSEESAEARFDELRTLFDFPGGGQAVAT